MNININYIYELLYFQKNIIDGIHMRALKPDTWLSARRCALQADERQINQVNRSLIPHDVESNASQRNYHRHNNNLCRP